MPKITIRGAEPDDFRHPLPNCAWDNGMSMPGTGGGDRSSSSVSWAEANGQAVGMLTGRGVPGEAIRPRTFTRIDRGVLADIQALAVGTWLIQGFGIDPHWRGKGVEQALLDEATRWAESAGLAGLSTVIGRMAPDLIDWFEDEGFVAYAECGGAYGTVAVPVTWVLLVRETLH